MNTDDKPMTPIERTAFANRRETIATAIMAALVSTDSYGATIATEAVKDALLFTDLLMNGLDGYDKD